MNENLEWVLIICGTLLSMAVAIFVISLPFAFLGWLLLLFVNVFGAGIALSYFNCAIVGIVTPLLLGWIAR